MNLTDYMHALRDLSTLTEVDALLLTAMADIGCDNFSYNYYPINFHQQKQTQHVLCTQPVKGWQEHYTKHQYHQIDPILQRMRTSHLPLGWKLEKELSNYDKVQKKLFSDALEFGLQGGFAVPIHAPFGVFANLVVQDVAVLKLIARYPSIEQTLQLVAYHYHAKVSYFLEKEKALAIPKQLTKREMECLHLTAQYKTAKEIAGILKITLRTVGFHIEHVIQKLGVANKHQAVIKAIASGLLSSDT